MQYGDGVTNQYQYDGLSKGKRFGKFARGVLALVLLSVAAMALLLAGCSHTHVSDGSGTSSPGGRFYLAVACNGASGRAYIDNTRKKIRIGIFNGNADAPGLLFEHTYTMTGSDITWKTYWSSVDTVSVEIYDWGNGVSNYNNMLHLAVSNHIALLVFALDKTSGKFVERR
jgi:hypothetical protein